MEQPEKAMPCKGVDCQLVNSCNPVESGPTATFYPSRLEADTTDKPPFNQRLNNSLNFIMGGTISVASIIGFPAPYTFVGVLCVCYSMFVQGNSAALTPWDSRYF